MWKMFWKRKNYFYGGKIMSEELYQYEIRKQKLLNKYLHKKVIYKGRECIVAGYDDDSCTHNNNLLFIVTTDEKDGWAYNEKDLDDILFSKYKKYYFDYAWDYEIGLLDEKIVTYNECFNIGINGDCNDSCPYYGYKGCAAIILEP